MNCLLVISTAVAVFLRGLVLCDRLCLTGDFDSQLQQVVSSRKLSAEDLAGITRMLDDVQNTLRQRWPNFEMVPFGSLAIGLGITTSDADIYIKLPNYSSLSETCVLQETMKLFEAQPQLFSVLGSEITHDTTRVMLFHIPEQRHIDVLYKFGDTGLVTSKLLKYYFNLNNTILPLGIFIKFWLKLQGLCSKTALPNFSVYLLFIFYLQQKKVAPSVYAIETRSELFVNDWHLSFNEIPYFSNNTESTYQLLGGFFKFYSEFSFEKYIVSTIAGRPIPRNAFEDIENFPIEFSLYKNDNHSLELLIQNQLNVSTPMCIQDFIVPTDNTAQRITHEDYAKFKYVMRTVARMHAELPSDRFLRAILTTQLSDANRNKYSVEDESRQDDCVELPLMLG